YLSRNYEKAADVFATAHRLNVDDKSVPMKWTAAISEAAAQDPEVKVIRDRGIAAAPKLTLPETVDLALGTDFLPSDDDLFGTVPTKPTHVIVEAAKVLRSINGRLVAGGNALELAPGTLVRVLKADGGWVLVARDGTTLGYVEAKALVSLQ